MKKQINKLINKIIGKRKNLEEKIAFRSHIATDMGTGGSYCSNCRYYFGSDPFKEYNFCPGCGYKLKDGRISTNMGGSDF